MSRNEINDDDDDDDEKLVGCLIGLMCKEVCVYSFVSCERRFFFSPPKGVRESKKKDGGFLEES